MDVGDDESVEVDEKEWYADADGFLLTPRWTTDRVTDLKNGMLRPWIIFTVLWICATVIFYDIMVHHNVSSTIPPA